MYKGSILSIITVKMYAQICYYKITDDLYDGLVEWMVKVWGTNGVNGADSLLGPLSKSSHNLGLEDLFSVIMGDSWSFLDGS